jgi:pyridoxal phosphate enzyme (YggS family)
MFIREYYPYHGGLYMSIAQNLAQIRDNIDLAVKRTTVERPGQQVKLIAVTKNQEISAIRQVIDNGITAIGENRVQEVLQKLPGLERTVECHLIGHLQTNKVRQIVPFADLIHSVDSQQLALEIDRIAGKLGKCQDILIQVNVAGEVSKFGISPDNCLDLARFISDLEHVRLCGLMTIAPHYEDPELVRPIFKKLHKLFMELCAMNLNNTNITWLSMGMTSDYIIAIEEGANMVRVGTGIFGARQYK